MWPLSGGIGPCNGVMIVIDVDSGHEIWSELCHIYI